VSDFQRHFNIPLESLFFDYLKHKGVKMKKVVGKQGVSKNENEFLTFFILVFGFIALSMISQMKNHENSQQISEVPVVQEAAMVSLLSPTK
jgi:hypothetical protein